MSSQIKQHFNYIVIGGGSGGIASARRAAGYGSQVSVGLMERDVEKMIGGTCVNVGCVPKKVMWNAGTLQEQIQHCAPYYGFSNDIAEKRIQLKRLKELRDAYVIRLRGIYKRNLENSGITLIPHGGKIVDAPQIHGSGVVTVQDTEGDLYTADHVLIATGGEPVTPAQAEVEGALEHVIDSNGFFQLEDLPKSAVVVGAGYIAVELAGILNALGTDTILVVRKHRAIRNFDETISEELDRQMKQQGIKVVTNFVPKKVERLSPSQLKVEAESGETAEGEVIVYAVGRTCIPNIKYLISDNDPNRIQDRLAVKDGYIVVDEFQNSSIPHVYAVGDVTGHKELTPVAIAAGRRLSDRLFGGLVEAKISYDLVPTVVFSHPPIGTIGLTEAEAEAKYGHDNIKAFVSKFANLFYGIFPEDFERPKTICKLVCKGEDETIVGLHVIGMGADEMLQGFSVALKMGATKMDFDNCIAIHPTASEEFVTLPPWSMARPGQPRLPGKL